VLDAENAGLTDRVLLGATAAAGLRALVVARLSENAVGDDCIAALSAGGGALEELRLGSTLVTDAGVQAAVAATKATLRVLDLGYLGKGLTEIGVAALADCEALEELHLSAFAGRGGGALTKTLVARAGTLRHLHLDAAEAVSDAVLLRAIHAPALDGGLCLLETLCVGGCQEVTDATLTEGACLPRLKRLDVWGCRRVGDGGLLAIAQGCRGLTRLDASRTGATSPGR
jgi:hypothetical protein